METIKEICQQMRDAADRSERFGGIYDMREISTDTFRVIADRIDEAACDLLKNILTKPHQRQGE